MANPTSAEPSGKMTGAAKWVVATFCIAFVAAMIALAIWWHRPMREIERSSKAVAHARSWHYRMVRRNPADPNGSLESFDKDTFCPSFQRTIQTGIGSNGQPVTFDYM